MPILMKARDTYIPSNNTIQLNHVSDAEFAEDRNHEISLLNRDTGFLKTSCEPK